MPGPGSYGIIRDPKHDMTNGKRPGVRVARDPIRPEPRVRRICDPTGEALVPNDPVLNCLKKRWPWGGGGFRKRGSRFNCS